MKMLFLRMGFVSSLGIKRASFFFFYVCDMYLVYRCLANVSLSKRFQGL